MFRSDFFYKLIYGIFFPDLGLGDGKERKKSYENDQLTGHFQSFFYFIFYFQVFWVFFFKVSPEPTVKLLK